VDYSYPLYCSCRRNADRVALVGRAGGPLTYEQLEERIAGTAAGLRKLLPSDAVVATLTHNEPAAFEVLMALARVGATAVPLNNRLATPELKFIVDDAGCTAVIASDQFLAQARDLAAAAPTLTTVVAVAGDGGPEPTLTALRATSPGPGPSDCDGDEDAVATIIYTSGTTGFPKGVARSHRANAWNAVNSALGSPRTVDDVEVFNLPAFGIGFLHFAMAALLGGATVVLDEAFDPARVWGLLESHRATRTFLAPTMINSMLAVPEHERFDLSTLNTVYTAYAFPERLRAAALEHFGEVFVYMYGLTEAQLTCATHDDFIAAPSCVGRSMGVSEVAVLTPEHTPAAVDEVGEIAFAGPSVMSGYHERPAENEGAFAGDWVLTGDLGRIDAKGDLHYVGRSKEMIKTGGFSVDPLEVENVLLEFDGVSEAAVVGVEDEHWGEEVVGFLVSSDDLDESSLLVECKQSIASYKAPKRLIRLPELPKNPTGKVEKGNLRKLAARR